MILLVIRVASESDLRTLVAATSVVTPTEEYQIWSLVSPALKLRVKQGDYESLPEVSATGKW